MSAALLPKLHIAFVADERLSREKSVLLTRYVNLLRQFAQVTLIPGGSTEEEVLARISAPGSPAFHLILAPWYRYLAWSKVEGVFGLTRTTGPTFAGYFCEPILPYELDSADHYRGILLDFCRLTAQEAALITRSLIDEKCRAGIRALIKPDTTIHCENWFVGQGLGVRIDALAGLQEMQSPEWLKRATAIRAIMTSLWSLVYEEGPAKSKMGQVVNAGKPKAYFQLAADERIVAMRLCYPMPAWSPVDALRAFWPDTTRAFSPAQMLARHGDFVRVHTVADTNDVEIVVALFPSAPSEKGPNEVHTLWIEPIAANLFGSEVPFEMPSSASPQLKRLATFSVAAGDAATGFANGSQAELERKDRYIQEAAAKLRELKLALDERDQTIREMRMGGLSTVPQMPPPDAEGLIEALQDRFEEVMFQMQMSEIQLSEALSAGRGTDADRLRFRFAQLHHRYQTIYDKLAELSSHVGLASQVGGRPNRKAG